MSSKDLKSIFQETIEQHKGILLKVARTYCSHPEDRQDLIQEMMIQIWRSLPKYNDRYKMSTFLYRISLNVAISFYRKHSVREEHHSLLTERVEHGISEEKTESEAQLILLEQFINELKEMDKALILLYLEDKSHAETAEILGMSVSNVGTKVGRIKEKLKVRLSLIKS